MKTKSIILIFFFISGLAFNQSLTVNEKGIYIDNEGKPFTGTYKEFYENGNTKREFPLINGIIDGEVILYFLNSQKNEIRSYKDGLMDGTWITWNKKGTKIAEANYLRGLKNGKWFIWDDNGILRYDMTYKNGKRTGEWRIWEENGDLITAKKYE